MSEPIITFNNRTLRVEHDGWYLEVKVLASGKQLTVRSEGTDLIIQPDSHYRVFVSSRASEKETENVEPERPDNKLPPATKRSGRA